MKKYLILAVLALASATASAATLFSDDFNYSNGSLAGPSSVSGGTWFTISATASQTGQVDVASSVVNLTATEAEDVGATLSGAPIASGTLYYSMLVNFSALPAGAGGYFANLTDTGTGLRARLFGTIVGATPGSFRLAINNGSTPPSATYATDLALGTWYQAVVRYDIGAVATTLWVNPLLETDPSVTATDVVGGFAISRIGLRQSTAGTTSMGTLTVDNVRVATTFDEVVVVPEPTSIALASLGGVLVMVHLRRRR